MQIYRLQSCVYTGAMNVLAKSEETDYQSMAATPGRRWVIGSLVFAAMSLAFAPVVFGPLGVIAGSVAVWKGAKLWGTAGVSASFVAAVFGFYLAIWLAT